MHFTFNYHNDITVGTVSPILCVRKLKHRESKLFAQSYTLASDGDEGWAQVTWSVKQITGDVKSSTCNM